MQGDLFETDTPRHYPDRRGAKTGGPSLEAAIAIESEAATLRRAAYRALQNDELTADEVAIRLGRSILAIRPRISELLAKGLIVDTGKRRFNSSGRRATVWRSG